MLTSLSHKRIIRAAILSAALAVVSSCTSTKEVTYFQDLTPASEQAAVNLSRIKIQPDDQLSIVVSCKDPQIASLFNLITPANRIYSAQKQFTTTGEMGGYVVTSAGDIDFPQLGKVHVEGLTREEVALKIKTDLESRQLVKDPVVTVDFINLHFSVIGEVTKPGYFAITGNRTSLLDAISMAGDLTIYGKRDAVKVVREENGQRKVYSIDLRSKDLFDSPAYYLQQNDIVYVMPNQTRAGQSNINENQWKNAGLWMSAASVLTSVAVLIFK